ncbi:hypothetical protein QFC21_006859 [Naganishia friedmannii]|uniref:Uncharacterized protein n=1 Tax=Naganishia friedmannii TaxID=89922 RepID=A0ACC2UZI6_9TREE|nr:hypothetical protein QFC21_006859 [Naganishia friedmannii]
MSSSPASSPKETVQHDALKPGFDLTEKQDPLKNTLATMSIARKHILLAVFTSAACIDNIGFNSLLTTTETIASDFELGAGNIVWVVTAYGMTFASFLLLAGRMADLYSAPLMFMGGLGVLSICFLAGSFVEDKYGFLILRAISGIAAAMNVPSA